MRSEIAAIPPFNSCSSSPDIVEGRDTGINRAVAKLGLDLEEAVVLGCALASCGCARLDLAAVERHCEVGDGGVLCLARAMREYRRPTGLLCVAHCLDRFRQCADLVHFREE